MCGQEGYTFLCDGTRIGCTRPCPRSPKWIRSTDIPFVLERLDVESKSRRDGIDILTVDPFQDGCLAGIVQSEHKQSNLLFLLAVLLEDSEQTHGGACLPVCLSVCGRVAVL